MRDKMLDPDAENYIIYGKVHCAFPLLAAHSLIFNNYQK